MRLLLLLFSFAKIEWEKYNKSVQIVLYKASVGGQSLIFLNFPTSGVYPEVWYVRTQNGINTNNGVAVVPSLLFSLFVDSTIHHTREMWHLPVVTIPKDTFFLLFFLFFCLCFCVCFFYSRYYFERLFVEEREDWVRFSFLFFFKHWMENTISALARPTITIFTKSSRPLIHWRHLFSISPRVSISFSLQSYSWM